MTPPTISLDLGSLAYAARNCAGHPCANKAKAGTVIHSVVKTQNAQDLFHSATCEVGSVAADCPMPKCQAYDHHDLHAKDAAALAASGLSLVEYCTGKHSTVITDSNSAATNVQGVRNSNPENGLCTHTFACHQPTFRPIQIDSTTATKDAQTRQGADKAETASIEAAMRKVRSEWVLRFDATDRAGNAGESVSFTMIFQDTQAPNLFTEFQDDHWVPTHIDNDNNSFSYSVYSPLTAQVYAQANTMTRTFAESCTACGRKVNADTLQGRARNTACTKPCTYTLKHSELKSVDKYENDDCTSNIEVRITDPSGTEVTAWTSKAALSDANTQIDTQKQGDWVVYYRSHDNAGIFGWQEADNKITQTVTIRISDNIKPEIYRKAHRASSYVTVLNSNPGSDAQTINGQSQEIHQAGAGLDEHLQLECRYAGSKYREPGAECLDLRESWVGNKYQAEAAAVSGDNMATHGKFIYNTDAKNVHVIKYDCDDGANTAFNGRNAANAAHTRRTITVVDTTVPVVTLNGPAVIENSAGKHRLSGRFESGKNPNHGTGLPNGNSPGDGGIGFFNPVEFGVGASRVDETNWSLAGTKQANTYGFGGEDTAAWKGAKCEDTCSTQETLIATLHEGGDCSGALLTGKYQAGDLRNFHQDQHEFSAHGTEYSIQYTCFDGTRGDARTRLAVQVCRKILQVDATKPILQILGSDRMTLEATHSGNYVDDGAACYDQVDGVISQNVEVSGDVVNLSKVGTYTVTYNCKDAAGNAAVPLDRTVVVRQTSCPRCSFNGATSLIHEASFSYVDAGAECSDEVDGVVRTLVSNPVDVERTGTYYVTYRACNSVGLCNDGKSTDGKSHTCLNTNVVYKRQVTIEDTLKPVLSVSYKEQGQWKQVAAGLGKDFAAPTGLYVHGTDTSNPADKWAKAISPRSSKFTHFMAESTASTGAWVWAAAASAIAGLALLAHGQRRTAITTVPV